MKKESLNNLELNSKVKKSMFRSLVTIYLINLKLTLRNIGIIIMGVFTVVLMAILSCIPFIVKLFMASDSLKRFKENASMASDIIYLIYGIFIGILIIFTVIYLFKKQRKLGLQNIELRSGINPFYIYLIRSAIALTVVWIWVLISVLLGSLIVATYPSGIQKGELISRLFFLLFYAMIFTCITLTVFQICTTVLGTLLMFVVFVITTMVPFFSGMLSGFTRDKVEYEKFAIRTNEAKKVLDFVREDESFQFMLDDSSFWTTVKENLIKNYPVSSGNLCFIPKPVEGTAPTNKDVTTQNDYRVGFSRFYEVDNEKFACSEDYFLGKNYNKLFEGTNFGNLINDVEEILNKKTRVTALNGNQLTSRFNDFWFNIENDLKFLAANDKKFSGLYDFYLEVKPTWTQYIDIQNEQIQGGQSNLNSNVGIFSLMTTSSKSDVEIDYSHGVNRYLLILFEMLYYDGGIITKNKTDLSPDWDEYYVSAYNNTVKDKYQNGVFNMFYHFPLMRSINSDVPFMDDLKVQDSTLSPLKYIGKEMVLLDESVGTFKRIWGSEESATNGPENNIFVFDIVNEKYIIPQFATYKKGFNVAAGYSAYIIIFMGFWTLGYPMFFKKIKE